jgi:hypothetical protein
MFSNILLYHLAESVHCSVQIYVDKSFFVLFSLCLRNEFTDRCLERSVLERSVLKRSGVERSALERSGSKRSGVQKVLSTKGLAETCSDFDLINGKLQFGDHKQNQRSNF